MVRSYLTIKSTACCSPDNSGWKLNAHDLRRKSRSEPRVGLITSRMRAEAILSKRNGLNSCIGCGGGEAARWSFRPIDDSHFTIGLSECEINTSSSLWLLAFTNKPTFLCMLTTRTTPGEPLCRVSVFATYLKFSVRGHSVLCLCHFPSDMFCARLNSAQALFRAIPRANSILL